MGVLEEDKEDKEDICGLIDTLKEIYEVYNEGLKIVDIETKMKLGTIVEAANATFMDQVESINKKVFFHNTKEEKDQKKPESDEVILNVDQFFESIAGLMETILQTEIEVIENGPFEREGPKKKKRSKMKRLIRPKRIRKKRK